MFLTRTSRDRSFGIAQVYVVRLTNTPFPKHQFPGRWARCGRVLYDHLIQSLYARMVRMR